MLIINNFKYIVITRYPNIPNSQIRKIKENKDLIKNQIIGYINGYIKAYRKNRNKFDYRYKYSTLQNYHKELGLYDNI